MAGVILKLGGSLFDLEDLDTRVQSVLDRLQQPTLIVAGGGRFADEVREFQLRHPELSDSDAHDAALETLSVSARLVASLMRLPLTTAWDRASNAVADASAMLRLANVYQDLPPSWDVTSDSVAATIARTQHVDRVVLLKSTSLPQSLSEAVETYAVDANFPAATDRLAIDWCNLRLSEVEINPTGWGDGPSNASSVVSTAIATQARDDLIGRAMQAAAVAHGAQVRKGEGVPYIVHPVEVCRVLREHGFHEELAELHAAALLHDSVEDTDMTLENVRHSFSPNVATWVSDASEIKCDQHGAKRSWSDRKSEHVTRLKNASWQACAVVLADKIHNVRDILAEPRDDAYWALFNATPAQMHNYYVATIESCLRQETETLAATLKQLVDDFSLRHFHP